VILKILMNCFTALKDVFDKEWKDWAYVTELANTPTKEESLSKLVWLLNYPVQHFVATLDQIAKKK
jgi:ribosomal protein L10